MHRLSAVKDESALGAAADHARSDGVGEGVIAQNIGLRCRRRRRRRCLGILGIHVDARRNVRVGGVGRDDARVDVGALRMGGLAEVRGERRADDAGICLMRGLDDGILGRRGVERLLGRRH